MVFGGGRHGVSGFLDCCRWVVSHLDVGLGVDERDLEESGHTESAHGAGSSMEQVRVLCSRRFDDFAVGKDDFNPVDGTVEEAVFEAGAFTSSTSEATANGDARKLHHYGWKQTMWHHSVYQLVHGDIGLDKACLCLLVDFENVVEIAGIDHASFVDFVLPGGVGRAMV